MQYYPGWPLKVTINSWGNFVYLNISSFLFIYFSTLKKTCECRKWIQKRFSRLHKIWFSCWQLSIPNGSVVWTKHRLPLPACNTPVSVSSVRGTLVRWCFLCEMAALRAEPSDWFHTADWTTNTLWTLVRDSRCNCGLDTVMSAIFHHWASSYCDMTAALTLPPEQDSPLAQTLVGEGDGENTVCYWLMLDVMFSKEFQFSVCHLVV